MSRRTVKGSNIVQFTVRSARTILPPRRQPPQSFGADGLAVYTRVLDRLDYFIESNPGIAMHVLKALDKWIAPVMYDEDGDA